MVGSTEAPILGSFSECLEVTPRRASHMYKVKVRVAEAVVVR